VDSLGSQIAVLVTLLRWSVVLSAWAGVDIFCVRSESVPRLGWTIHFGPGVRRWGPPEPVARPLARSYWVARVVLLGVLGIIQVQPALWIGQAGSNSGRNGLIGLSIVFYTLELAWWVWLGRLPREKIYSTLPRDKEARDRMIAQDVASILADRQATALGEDPAQEGRPR
jgi:hypothetical protein